MNNNERKKLRKIADKLSDAVSAMLMDIQEVVQGFADNEQEKIDNMPENLQYGERAERMREYVDALEGVCYDIDNMIIEIDDVATSINDIADDSI